MRDFHERTAYEHGQRVEAYFYRGHRTVRGTVIAHHCSLHADAPDEVEVLVDGPEFGIHVFTGDRVRALDVVEVLAEVVTRPVFRAGEA